MQQSNNNNNNNTPTPSQQDSSLDNTNRSAEYAARVKEAGRESRFSFRNLAEHQLRRELKDVAMEKCNPQIKEFAECSQEKGLFVVWSCRHLFRQVNECMATNNSEEAWQQYKTQHEDEIARRAKLQKPL